MRKKVKKMARGGELPVANTRTATSGTGGTLGDASVSLPTTSPTRTATSGAGGTLPTGTTSPITGTTSPSGNLGGYDLGTPLASAPTSNRRSNANPNARFNRPVNPPSDPAPAPEPVWTAAPQRPTPDPEPNIHPQFTGFKKGGRVKKMAKGGSVSKTPARKRGHGCEIRGNKGGYRDE